jgi:hypothetical protein
VLSTGSVIATMGTRRQVGTLRKITQRLELVIDWVRVAVALEDSGYIPIVQRFLDPRNYVQNQDGIKSRRQFLPVLVHFLLL